MPRARKTLGAMAPPLDDGDVEAMRTPAQLDRTAHLIKLAGKATARALQNRLAKHSVAYGHWTFLRILWTHDGISVTELSERAGVAKPSTAVAVQAMERLGYVTCRQRAGNRKKVFIYLAPAGRRLEAKLVPLAIEVNEIAQRGLNHRQAQQLRLMLATAIRNLDRDLSESR